MVTITLDIVVSSNTQIKVDWAALTGDATGLSPIDSYGLEWNASGSTWLDLKGQDGNLSTTLTHTVTGLTGGLVYKFKLRAHNVHGWSIAYSPEFSFMAAQVPATPIAVTTSYTNLNVRITWVAPFANFKDISKY